MFQKLAIATVLVLVCCQTIARDGPLSDYEGLYEYQNESSLIIASGPKNELLYAVINGARYPLRPSAKDVFLNANDQSVLFVRDDAGAVIGYRELSKEGNGEPRIFGMLDSDKRLPRSFWHAGPDDAALYSYRRPASLGDGIQIGERMQGDPLRQSLVEMTRNIHNNEYPWTQSVLVFQRDRLVYEEYFYEYEQSTRHQLRSATKTLVALLAGIAIDQGLIESIDEPVIPYFDDYTNLQHVDTRKRAITLGDLLSMQSGLACNDWDADSLGNEGRMAQSDDWARFALDLPMQHEPGTHGSYCSGNVIITGRMIEIASGMALKDFADEFLFGPMGITDYEWDFRPDRSNIDNFTQAWMRPRDMLKIGMLMSRRGEWQGQQIISAGWIDALMSEQATIAGTPYGYYFWLRYLNDGQNRYEIHQVSGNGGQKIIHLPAQDAIVVMTGGNYNQKSNTNRILASYLLKHLD
ncbi:MAG: serine hydrolase domain-containing protein [Phycisphaerales bacterium]